MQDQTNRDYTQPFNQLRPRSTASSGLELDEICGEITQGEAGKGLDKAIKLIDGAAQVGPSSTPTTSRAEAIRAAAQENTPVPPITREGNEEAVRLGKGLSSWKDTKIGTAPSNPMSGSMDKIFRR